MKAELCSGSLAHLREMTAAFLQELKASLGRQALADLPIQHSALPDRTAMDESLPGNESPVGRDQAMSATAWLSTHGMREDVTLPSNGPHMQGKYLIVSTTHNY